MYDYSGEPRARVENVDHEIHIMGIKLGYFPYLLWGFLIGLFAGGPLTGFVLIAVAAMVCRAFFKAEERGEPVMFDPKLAALLGKLPRGVGDRVLGGIAKIERSRPTYRD